MVCGTRNIVWTTKIPLNKRDLIVANQGYLFHSAGRQFDFTPIYAIWFYTKKNFDNVSVLLHQSKHNHTTHTRAYTLTNFPRPTHIASCTVYELHILTRMKRRICIRAPYRMQVCVQIWELCKYQSCHFKTWTAITLIKQILTSQILKG